MNIREPTKIDHAWYSFRPFPGHSPSLAPRLSLTMYYGVESPAGSQKSLHAGSVWTAISLYLYTRVVQRRCTCTCSGVSGDMTAVVCTVQRSHLSTTVSPLKNDGGPTVKQRFGHHRLNCAQFNGMESFLTHTVYYIRTT